MGQKRRFMENFPGNTDAKNSDIAIQYCLVPLEDSSEFCVCLEYEWPKRDTFGKTDYYWWVVLQSGMHVLYNKCSWCVGVGWDSPKKEKRQANKTHEEE